ncbi:hypothetical protein RM531_03610 [Salinisphaera sp. P385]|uniref:Uncharacterized protein n=1 Tax=Spectribacter acetivorans TaxID=3075603 RepID=A0ABU3B5P6_9GAMM|nr:hypothetical protein [Salinisphaera sp. P385]MDT0617549.1 hypothetical protein [Salinisphaera sp. P385]
MTISLMRPVTGCYHSMALLKKAILALFQRRCTQTRFALAPKIKRFQRMILAVRPCTARDLPKNGVFQQPPIE